MAYFSNPAEDEENKQLQPGEKVIASGESSTLQGNPGGQQGGQPVRKGSGFTNLIQYVNANKGNDATMGNDVRTNVGEQVKGAGSQADTFKGNVANTVATNTVKDNNIVNALKSNPLNVKKEDFQKQYNATWQGPNAVNEVDGYQDVAGKYSNLQQKAQLSDDFEGRKELLKDVYKRPTYSQGEQRLDSFILGAGDEGSKTIQQVKQDVSGAQSNWDKMITDINSNLAAGKATTDKTRADTQAAYGQAVTGQEQTFDNLMKQLAAEKTNNASKFNTLEANLSSADAKAREAAYKELGLDTGVGEFLKTNNFDLGRLSDENAVRELGDAASAQDIAKYNALMALQDGAGKYEFKKAGGDGNYFKANSAILQSGKDASALNQSLKSRWEQEQQARNEDYAFTKAALSGQLADPSAVYNQLGISAEDMALSKGGEFGNHNYQAVDPLSFLSKGKDLALGNVAKAEESAKWSALMTALGLNKPLETAANTGSAYNFDKEAFLAAINAGKSVDAQTTTSGDVIHGINKGIRDGSYTTNQEVQRAPDNIGAAGTNVAQVLSGKKKLIKL